MAAKLQVAALSALLMMSSTMPALASCRAPDLSEQIQRAEIIADGTVTAVGLGGGSLTFRPRALFKGSLPAGSVTVRTGPTAGAVTSVDYSVAAGTHVLYLRREGGAYVTDACSGSHPGPPSTDELRALGSGMLLGSEPTAIEVALDQPLMLPGIALGALIALVVALIIRRRVRGARPGGP